MADYTDNSKRKSIVDQEGFTIKKKFSQNFLLDENIIHKIVDSTNIDQNTGVIEIGPGLGALTKHIVKQAKQVLVYEVDNDLIPYLNEFFAGQDNFTLLHRDILKADIQNDIHQYLSDCERIVVISNLPYHITTPIIMRFLEDVKGIHSMIFMMQLEVAKRITSEPDTKDYNALSVIIQHQTEAKYLFKVPKKVFHPQPNVDSAVIRLVIKPDTIDKNNHGFYEFVHKCFAQRRKTLINNLSNGYNKYTKSELADILEESGINPLTRAEALDLESLLQLYEGHFNQL